MTGDVDLDMRRAEIERKVQHRLVVSLWQLSCRDSKLILRVVER